MQSSRAKSLVMIFVLFFSFTVICPLDGFARKQDVAERFVKPMPEYPKLSKEEFLAVTQQYHGKPYEEDLFEYSVRLPKDWNTEDQRASSNFLVSDKLFTDLNTFFSAPRIGGRSRVEIKALNLDFQLTALQWYIKYLLEGGYTTEAMVVHSDTKVEGLSVVMEGDTTYILRTIIELNGDKVIAMEYYIPNAYWEDEKALQAQIMETFVLKNKVPVSQMALQKYQFLDIAEIQYPASWKVVAAPMRSVDIMSAKILNVKDNTIDSTAAAQGNIDITLVANSRSDSFMQEINEYKRSLESTGMIVGKKIDVLKGMKYPDTTVFSVSEVYEGVDSANDFIEYELWFTVVSAGNYYFFITLLTPARSESYVAWSYNTQGYKTIVESLVPTIGAFIERSD